MQIEFKDRARYQLIRRTAGLHLKFRAGKEERPVLCQLEAGSILTAVGKWLTLPSITRVECNGTLYAVFTQDLKDCGKKLAHGSVPNRSLQSAKFGNSNSTSL